ncbi:MAG: flagellar hook-associated protein FlgL [Synergistaceae bacterium]|jgi:flagellin-like hook-associated protein FlgL|nr:flagellar hook-associated protein FlgL [Synergistaceae bacterium]
MANRVTTAMMYGSLTGTLHNNMQKLLDLERQMATQKKYSKMSDNPSEIARALSLESSITANTQYIKNQNDAGTMLVYAETALDSAMDILHEINYKVIEAGNGSLDASAVASIAEEIDILKGQLLDTLNTKIAGKYIFGGTDTATQPFVEDANGSIRYVGSNERIRYEVEEGLLSDVSFTGQDIMPNAYKSYFVCSHYVPLDWQWTGREEKVQITVGNRTLSVFIPEQWIDEYATGSAKPTDYNQFRDPDELSGLSLDDLATLVNRALKEQGADMLVTASVEKDYGANQHRLVFKSNTGESISVTGWSDTDYMPMAQSVDGLEMNKTDLLKPGYWNQNQLAGNASVNFTELAGKDLSVYLNDSLLTTVDLSGYSPPPPIPALTLKEQTEHFAAWLDPLLGGSVKAIEQGGKIAFVSPSGDTVKLDGTGVDVVMGGIKASVPPKYEGLMGAVNTLGWKGDGLGKEIDINGEIFKLDDYKNVTELVTDINTKMSVDAGDLPFASIVSGRLVLQSTKGSITVKDSGANSGGTMRLFGYDGSGSNSLKSSSSSLSLQLGDAHPIKIYINEGDDLVRVADRLNSIEGVYARPSADNEQLVVVAQRTGDLSQDPLTVDAATEKLHYPSFILTGEGMAMSLFNFTYAVDSATGIETGVVASKEQTRPVDHSHIDVFNYLGMETALKSVEFEGAETLKVGTLQDPTKPYDPISNLYTGTPLHWRVTSGRHTTDIKLNPGEYTMEELAERLKNAGAEWLEVVVDVSRINGDVSMDDTEIGLDTSKNEEKATSRLVIRSLDGSPVTFLDMNDQRYAEEMGLSTAVRADDNMGVNETKIKFPTAPCLDDNLAVMMRVQKTCGKTYDIRLARKDIQSFDSSGKTFVDRVKVMEQIAKQVNAQEGQEVLKVIIPMDENGQKLTGSASLVAITGEPFTIVDLPVPDPNWNASYTSGLAAQMGIHGGVTSNLELAGVKDDTKMDVTGTIRFETLGHSVKIDVTAGDTVKTIMDRLRSQAGDWLYVNYFDQTMGNAAGQEGDFPIISIAAKDGSPVNVIDVKGSVAQDKLLLNTSIQGAVPLVDASGIPSSWQTTQGAQPPQTFSITVAGYTHTIDLTAMRDINGNGLLDGVDLVAEINARMQDYDVKAELNDEGRLVLWSPRGYTVAVLAQENGNDITNMFLGAATPSTPYRGGYDLENTSRTAPGIYTQNVTVRGGANQTKQNFFGVLDDISTAVRAENRDGLSNKLLPMINNFIDGLLKVLSTNGALQARYEGNVQRMKANDLSMTETHDSLVAVDLADMSTQLMMAQAIYQASLGIMSYIVQPTLLDFLR